MELTVVQSIIFGVVQGVTEFLPISSSGHIVLVQYFFGIDDPHVGFIVALHVGSLFAVLIYFWRDWLNIFHIKKDMQVYQDNSRLLLYVILATIPAVIGGLFLSDAVEGIIFSPIITSALIVVGSLILFVADRSFGDERSITNIGVKESIIIGIAQVIALVPGISRSGMTIAGARLCRLTRVDAARFSFLIATPIIAGAGIMQMKDIAFSYVDLSVVIGMVTSFIAAIVTIHYFLALIQKVSYAVFLYYSVALFVLVSVAM